MISVKKLTKKFGDFVAVDNIDFEVNKGEIFGFLGPNGAGKTTTIKMITGIIPITSGSIEVGGIDVTKDQVGVKKQLSYVPDNPDIYEEMTVIEYCNFLANIYDVSLEDREKRFEKFVKLFELEGKENNVISTLSHGMKQKVALIGSLINDPSLWILDEPIVGLDTKSSFDLKNLMKERAKEGKTIFFSTHIMEIAEKLCDRIAIISNGKIVAIGTLEEIRENSKNEGKDLEDIFLELTDDKNTTTN